MGDLRVSVALCTCNGAAYIGEQLRSILAQTRRVAEIVVRDDASDDATLAELQASWEAHRWAVTAEPPPLRITRNPRRLGVARNFEAALRDCRGDLIALCDQDDVWDPQRLAILLPRFEADARLLLLHGDARLVDGQGQDLGSTLFQALNVTSMELEAISEGQGWQPLLGRNLVTGATVLLRRSLCDAAIPIPDHWLHDEWLGIVAALLGGLAVERRCLLAYRQHSGNQIGARRASLADLASRALGRREQWHAQKLHRARELHQRAAQLPGAGPAEALAEIEEKVLHQAVRASLPATRIARLLPVLREWRTGRYRRFGRGIQGVLRDLLQPE
ncbi:glycosyltransferase family 2 protein [Ramlibacter tataouinensis]|uniref:Candidate b-glycosyltransferase, Glycosyltransferase Family 2 n=1 Tax=Ramlibacter tataouinensis (strain ATCC BAA-407 / DSM 14655 / LMG 21543 / TTB310) TaxID=365046 RepID=F5XYX5_RAMTT|nr:glycosyltransferase family 2 protein [Ramlibacter tataouinensis]AEG91963.1 candidate b-glycosyltransferase, Glycosyltransferase Family 2 [Ramlibacter tataouinensis TTB310]